MEPGSHPAQRAHVPTAAAPLLLLCSTWPAIATPKAVHWPGLAGLFCLLHLQLLLPMLPMLPVPCCAALGGWVGSFSLVDSAQCMEL